MAESAEKPAGTPKKPRIESLDAFRGFTIFGMIFVIHVAGFRYLPLTFPHFDSAPVSTFKHAGADGAAREWAFWEKNKGLDTPRYREAVVKETLGKCQYDVALKDETGTVFSNVKVVHAKRLHPNDPVIAIYDTGTDTPRFRGVGNGCTFTDWVAPFFVFIVGICIPLSRQRRGKEWWKHVGVRTLGLIFLGVVYISLILKVSYWWGILQAIGISYFMGAAFMVFRPLGRWIVVAVIAIVHGWMSWNVSWWLELGDASKPFLTIANTSGDALRPLTVHCTPWASISYGLITIVGTILGDTLATRDRRKFTLHALAIGIGLSIVGVLLHHFQAPMNKDYVSPAYSIFTSGLGALCFLGFYYVIDVWGFRLWAWPLNVFGANALLAYFMQPVVRIFFQALGFWPFLISKAGWAGMLAGFIWTFVLWVVVLICNKRGIYWKL